MIGSRPRPRSGGLGACCLALAVVLLASAAQAGERSPVRPYVNLRLGEAFFLDSDGLPGAELETPSGQPAAGFTIGADLSRYWGVELATDYVKTTLSAPGAGTLGDYSMVNVTGLVRLRYPSPNGRTVPFALMGGGIGFGEFSGRKNFAYPIGGGGSSGLGVFGAGLDYFLAPNLAFVFEGKYNYAFGPGITLNGQEQEFDADSIALTGGLRLYFDRMAFGQNAAALNPLPAKDSDARRWYLALRGGKAIFTNPEHFSLVHIDDWSGLMLSAAVGANASRHVGAEMTFEYARAQLRTPAGDKITGYPIWTILGLLRFRQPMAQDRFSPYVVLGGGVGFAEVGDYDVPQSMTGFRGDRDSSFVAAAGGGFDYFLEHNIALNVELRDTFLFDTDVSFNGQPATLNPSFISFTAGFRIFFP